MKGERRTFQADNNMCKGPASRGSQGGDNEHRPRGWMRKGSKRVGIRLEGGKGPAALSNRTFCDGANACICANQHSRYWPHTGTGH